MPTVLNLTAQELDSSEKRCKFTVGIVGCGQKGVFYANALAGASFRIFCTDSDPSIVKKVAKGKTAACDAEAEAKLKHNITKGQVTISGDIKKVVSQSDI